MTRNLILFLTIIFVGLAGYYFVRFGYYPVALVNGKLITAKLLNERHAAAMQYYVRTLSEQNLIELGSREAQKELRRAALHDLIAKSLVSAELEKRIGDGLESAIESKIKSANVESEVFAEAAKAIYGLDLAAFREMVLVPQAEKELLEARLSLERKNFDEWLKEAANAASVIILTPEFAWDTNKVIAR